MQLKKAIALFLCLLLCMQVLTGSVFATDPNIKTISGDGVKVEFQAGTISLYRLDGNNVIQMSKPSTMGYPIINGEPLQDFAVASCEVEQNVSGLMGNGERMTITSVSISTGLTRTYVIETSSTQFIQQPPMKPKITRSILIGLLTMNLNCLALTIRYGVSMEAAKVQSTIMTQFAKSALMIVMCLAEKTVKTTRRRRFLQQIFISRMAAFW